MGLTLYEIGEEFKLALCRAFDMADEDGVIPDEGLALLDAAEGDLRSKATNYCAMLAAWKAEAEVIRGEEQRLAARRRTIENNRKRLQDRLHAQLVDLGIDRFDLGVWKLTVAKTPAPAIIDNEKALPKQFKSTQVVIDKRGILEALRAGETVRGAHLGEQGTTLRIR